jgi:CRP-like cAMP-binding protein
MVPSSNSLLETDTAGRGQDHPLRFYSKGEVIPCVQGIWQVYKGVVQLSTLYPNGEEGLLGWVGPSMCFGSTLTCLQTYQAKALSDVYVMGFSIAQIEASPQLAQQLVPQLSRRLRQMEALLAIVGLRRVEDRLHQLLGLLKQELGMPVAEGTRLTIRLTHQDLAGAIGTSRVTVTRLLGQLKKQGIITFDSKRHLIIKEVLLTQATDSLFIEK